MDHANFSYASLSNLPLMEALYNAYLSDPQSIDPSWRYFFEGMEFGSKGLPKGTGKTAESPELRVYLLINAYRLYGHLLAKVNPIAMHPPTEVPELNLEKLGFKQGELSVSFPTCGFLKESTAPLSTLIEALKNTYCRNIGIEYMGQGEAEMEHWLQKRIEPHFPLELSQEEKMSILHYLKKAELFESFLHTKYAGQKRFSLEGGETLIPMLDAILETGAEEGVTEVVLGMAHRGRLNVLANILNKSYSQIFHEFEDTPVAQSFMGTGDVKYHKGFSGSLTTRTQRQIPVILSANPSHLEAVDPVVEGQVRAKQELRGNRAHRKGIVPILIHGDAAVAGQGVVYETLQLSKLTGYSTGGTIHIVVNNQIGFTTLPKDSRSTRYCTDIAKAFGAPVFHVNAEDPEGCVAVAKIAIQMRQKFQCDVFIDLNCYRKYGHNEGDEPTFTQPLEYQLIKEKKTILNLYESQLIDEQVITREQVDAIEAEFKQNLHRALEETYKSIQESQPQQKRELPSSTPQVPTSIPNSTLVSLAEIFSSTPKEFNVHPKIQKLVLQERLKMVHADPNASVIDWGMGETLAYATLLNEGTHVRISGQDCRRGTFSHRHAMVVDQTNEQKYFPLSHLREGQGRFDVFNSSLSEYAVLGFEFGYALSYPTSLIIWEAQFGDFANGAQIIIDQFLTASEQKWGHPSHLTLMLPHGNEGQGPEHSSARIERFLQLAGDNNIRIVNCTTPAQLFHVLRRQVKCPEKKPLIIFTPKALLRHPLCTSPLNAFSQGDFQEILDDPQPSKKTKRLLLCSGKVYYDLIAEREKRKVTDTTIVRIEQLFPLNVPQLKELLKKYEGFEKCLWVQEEHSNMGAWDYIRPILNDMLGFEPEYAGRVRSASPAAGSHALHKTQLAAFLEDAFKNSPYTHREL